MTRFLLPLRAVRQARCPQVRVRRGLRPGAEILDERLLLSTMVGNFNGISGVSGGSVWHYQDNGGWSQQGGSGVSSVVDSQDSHGNEVLFARLNGGAIWSYNYSTGVWNNTGGHLDNMIANGVGISGTAGGSVWHYQDNNGWGYIGGLGVNELVDTYNNLGQEEMMARVANGAIWEFNFSTNVWRFTGGYLDQMIANENGVSGTASGHVWHYEDDAGWDYTQGWNVARLVDSHNDAAQDEMFVLCNDRSVWSYTFATSTWRNTGGHLDNLIANIYGVTGTTNGYGWSYRDNSGWYFNGGSNIISLINATDKTGDHEMVAETTDGSLWEYKFETHLWTNLYGHLD